MGWRVAKAMAMLEHKVEAAEQAKKYSSESQVREAPSLTHTTPCQPCSTLLLHSSRRRHGTRRPCASGRRS